jgi:hypothetical protein
MGWVRDERGLGGSRNLDGLAWDLPVEELWESWVQCFATDLAPCLGLVAVARDRTRRGLNWMPPISSMGSLVPDGLLQGRDRAVLLDAKYKLHLDLLARKGWLSFPECVRVAHRADLHQALAYAHLVDVPLVDTILAYPTDHGDLPMATSTLSAGRTRVRLHLFGLPFGFTTPVARANAIENWRARLIA